jgi:hypothetical protein
MLALLEMAPCMAQQTYLNEYIGRTISERPKN